MISKHAPELLKTMIADISLYSIKDNLKEKCFDQIYNLVICCEENIKPLSNDLLKLLYKHIFDSNTEIAPRCHKIA